MLKIVPIEGDLVLLLTYRVDFSYNEIIKNYYGG